MTQGLYGWTDAAIVRSIGQKIKSVRIAKKFTQAQLAEHCGLSSFSISQIENGHNTSLLSIVVILRSLQRLDLLETLTQEEAINPLAIIEYQKKHPQRQRVTNGIVKPKQESEW